MRANTMELEKIREIIAGLMAYNIDDIKEHTRFIKDLGMDSLDVYQLVIEIEIYFGVYINDGVISRLKTVRDAAEMVRVLV
jgi:acyl carrier protein